MIHSTPMIPLEDALHIVDQTFSGKTLPFRKVSVRDAVGQTLASDQVSRLPLPPFDKAAMDGYAIRAEDACDRYQVLETVPAGSTPTGPLRPGTAVKVMTGAPVPAGTGQVIPIEEVRYEAGIMQILRPTEARNICLQGEDVRVGDVILRAGTRLGALEIANLISCGITEVDVFRPIRLAVLSTGDEIVDRPCDLSPGKIMNANGPLLAGLGRQFAMGVVMEESIPDDRAATVAALARAIDRADLVVLSGGVSVGDCDYVGDALADAGLCVHFSSVAVKPGRPLTFASRAGAAVFGLPGNPVSVYVMFHLFVLRAMACMQGSAWVLRAFPLRLRHEFRRYKTDRVEFVPCRIDEDALLVPVEFHGSADLSALMEADGLLVIPLGTAMVAAGQSVQFVPLARCWQ